MAMIFKRGLGIPQTDFQNKLKAAIGLIGYTVKSYPNNPIVKVFGAPKEIDKDDIKSYYYKIKPLIPDAINYNYWIKNIDAFEIWAEFDNGILHKFQEGELNYSSASIIIVQ
jgi:hypothetical protein